MLNVLVRAVFGTKHERDAKRMRPVVEAINAQEPALERLSDSELKAKTDEFRKRLADGAELDDLLVEAFAVCREAARRTVRMRHFDVQLMRHGPPSGEDLGDGNGRGQDPRGHASR